jgi:DNA (cytosine-5)-methyltransferase 1
MAQTFAQRINTLLRPKPNGEPLVLDLFAGCGGLALGFEANGFATLGFEMDADAAATYRKNLLGHCEQVRLTVDTPLPEAKVIIGGPPCQPFSVGGHQLGLHDTRDGFPMFISAVVRLDPDIWIFENVRGLFYQNRWYLDEVIRVLESLDYVVEIQLLNAVQHGVPQNRERIVVVGHRGEFKYPEKTLKAVTAGEALGELAFSCPPESKFLTPSMDAYVAKYEKASKCINPRDLNLDRPARTITCRNLAGATGDMMRVRLSDGRRRRMLEREGARLQSFPDWVEFVGNETSRFDQIGNAVPPLLAYELASRVRSYLESDFRLSKGEIAARRRPTQAALFA